jgi:hypothetical protein
MPLLRSLGANEGAVFINISLLPELGLAAQQAAGNGPPAPRGRSRGGNRGTGDSAFAKRGAATGADKLVEFAGRQDQEQSLAHGL